MNRKDSKQGEMIANYIKEGLIIPGEITVDLIEQAMRKKGWNKFQYLIDGFPRNMDNMQKFENMLAHLVNIKQVLFFECSLEEMEKRVMKRAEITHGARSDDNIESLRKRFKVFTDQSMPIVEHYQKQSKVITVDAMKNVEIVWADLQKLFQQKISHNQSSL